MGEEIQASVKTRIPRLIDILSHNDYRKMLLMPDSKLGEIAVCNPARLGEHFVYRVRVRADNAYHEKSLVKYQKINNSLRLNGNPRTILSPEYEYEKDGIEDPRISKNEEYNIVYTAFNEDGQNGGAKIALATTEDFKRIKKHGIIGPEIRIKEVTEVLGENSYYGKILNRERRDLENQNLPLNPFIMDKDATIVYTPSGKKILLHRIANAIQATPFNSFEDLQKKEFWLENLKKLENQTILYPSRKDSSESWASEKVGLGGTPRDIEGRLIGHIHGVEKKITGSLTEYTYRSTFAEFDPETYKITSILRDSPLNPHPDFALIEKHENDVTKKYINFATEVYLSLRGTSKVCSLSGAGDMGIELRAVDKDWLIRSLSHPHNSIKNWESVAP